MSFNPTNEQKNALDAKGRVLVCAAAGSGKTAVLVERVANYILNANPLVDADRLVVVTFTNAAAAEMKSRIARRISDELRKNPNSSRLKRQQFLLTKANISTIDSYCINLVREYFYKLDISPDFKIADNSILNQIQNNVLESIVKKHFENPSESFSLLLDLLGGEYAERNLKEAVLQIYSFLRSIPFIEPFVENINKMYSDFTFKNSLWVKTIFNYAKLCVDDTINTLREAIKELEQDEALFIPYIDGFLYTLECLLKLKDAILDKDWDKCFKICAKFKPVSLDRVYKYPDEAYKNQFKDIKNRADAIIAEMAKLFFAPMQQIEHDVKYSAPAIKKLMEIVMEFTKQTLQEKKKRNLMDFADVEYAALELLVEYKDGKIIYTDIAKELSSYYHEVLVDEYQDTNDLQDTIFKALSESGKKLFMVGDVKQSIYRFRNANPQIFLNNRASLPLYKEGAKESKVIMSGNFRSALDICHYINFTFRLLMSQNAGQMDYQEEDELINKINFGEIDADRVQLHIINKEPKAKDELEPAYLAQLIKQTVGKKVVKEDDGLRVAKFSDIAILLRSRTQIPVFERVFRQYNIPIWADERGGFLQTKEIITILSLLKVIDNPTRDVALLSLFMSDLYSFTADEVAEIRISNKKSNLYSALVLHSKFSEKSKSFLDDIKLYRQWSVSMPVSELIRKIYEDTGYINTVLLYDNGQQAKANLIMLIEYAKNYEANGVKGLSRFIKYLEYTEKSEGLKQASIISESDNAVKIMTIHRSKGLQFPICIVAHLDKKFNINDRVNVLQKSEKLGVGLKIKDSSRNISYSTIAQNAISIENHMLSMSEELRVLYVALTRAKDTLILSACVENLINTVNKITTSLNLIDGKISPLFVLKTQNYLNLILACALLHPEGKVLRELASRPPIAKPTDGKLGVYLIKQQDICLEQEEKEEVEVKPNLEWLEKLRQQLSYHYPFDKINTIAAKQSASAIAQSAMDDKYWFSAKPAFILGEKLSGAQKGTALHKFMQYCNFKSAKLSVEDEISRLVSSNHLSELEADSLDRQKLKAFFLSSLYNRIEVASFVEKEFKFMVEFPATFFDSSLDEKYKSEFVVVQGVVDNIFEEDGKLVIVDYKTDKVKSLAELADKYSVQLKVYEKAISKVLKREVSELILYSFELSDMITV